MGTPFGLLFIQLSNNNWISYGLIEQEAPHPYFCKAKVYTKSNTTNQIISFNPLDFPDFTQSFWLYEEGYIFLLYFDPKEWNWRKLGSLQETSLFNYKKKRVIGKLVKSILTLAPYDKELQRLEYTPLQRQSIHKKIWHIWKFKKNFFFLMALSKQKSSYLEEKMLEEKINLFTNCRLCNNEEEEDEEHVIFTCPSFKYAWDAFNGLRRQFSLSTLSTSEEVKTRILPQPHQILLQEEIEWDSKSSFILTKEIPWELLRSSLFWNI